MGRDFKMAGNNDNFNLENIRYSLGVMEHTMISLVDTHKNHQHGLKNRDPVMIIHKDDFKKIIDELPNESLKIKFSEIYMDSEDW